MAGKVLLTPRTLLSLRPLAEITWKVLTILFAEINGLGRSTLSSPFKSRNASPSDSVRICFSSSCLNSLAWMMMFRIPKFSITLRLSRSAPAPIDSIAITAPTPKIIPSMVRNDRSLRR